jgi:hypothetical protein
MALSIPLEAVCRIILRAREYETLVPESDPDEGSDAIDDGAVDVLEDGLDEDGDENPSEAELRAAIDDLAEDEQLELIALALVGRGDFEAAEWAEAIESAGDETNDAADWALDQPTFSTDLENGLAAFDLSCDGVGTLV